MSKPFISFPTEQLGICAYCDHFGFGGLCGDYYDNLPYFECESCECNSITCGDIIDREDTCSIFIKSYCLS